MPKGPQGQKRPADTVGAAVMVAKIATGEAEEDIPAGREGKINGGKMRSNSMTAKERSELATRAAGVRWRKG